MIPARKLNLRWVSVVGMAYAKFLGLSPLVGFGAEPQKDFVYGMVCVEEFEFGWHGIDMYMGICWDLKLCKLHKKIM